jgi:uncharacterized membrane protein
MSSLGFPRRLAAALVVGAAALFAADDARANFQICNMTTSRVGVAIGYNHDGAWTTEGWWNMVPGACETVIAGPLRARFYYVHAVDYDRGGEWGGNFFMCTQPRVFTIRDIGDCAQRGFERTGFFEIDTGEMSTWAVQLTEPGRGAPPAPAAGRP